MTESRVHTITFNAPCAWLTANVERNHYQRAAMVRAWRTAVFAACQLARLPKGVTPVRIHVVIEHVSKQSPVRDRLNFAPTVKALVDGLSPEKRWVRKGVPHLSVGYGLLPDDSDRHVLHTTWEFARMANGHPGLLGRVTMTITEVA